MKYSNFQAIPQFPKASYRTDVPFTYIREALEGYHCPEMGSPLILNPDFQRGHVWTEAQQISFIEFILAGGETGKDIYFNCSSWNKGYGTPIYCVDGLQRLMAVTRFMNNEIPAYGTLVKDYEGAMRMTHIRLSFNVLCIENKRDLLNLYVMFNSGGTVHKPEEIARVRKMIEETHESETL